MADYRIEWRAGVPVVLGDGDGCHPASDAEVAFWRRIAELEAALEDVTDELEDYEDVRDGPSGDQRPNWAMSTRLRLMQILAKASRTVERRAQEGSDG